MVLIRGIKWFADLFMRRWYSFINRSDHEGILHFMNYGYDDSEHVALSREDEPERYPIQLYHHTATREDVHDKDLLEVGCGRGGGLSYVHRYLKPRSTTGVDLNSEAIAFCDQTYPGIAFHEMDAQQLTFADASFDVVLNVESSHRYPDFGRFAREVYRVLRPGGHLLFTDFRYAGMIEPMTRELAASGLTTVHSEVINEQVMAALRKDAERRVDLIRRYIPRPLHGTALEFAGAPGTRLFRSLERERRVYVCMALRKGR